MGQNQRRPGFLRWGEGARGADADASAESAVPPTSEGEPAPENVGTGNEATAEDVATTNEATAEGEPAAEPAGDRVASPDATPFLRDLVGAMRGVAESSRETTVTEFRQSVEARVEELKAAAAERAGDLRRRSELDLGGIGDWERSELERVRAEAEQRRKTRRELLEKELAEHQSASDRELEAMRARLADYEREMDDFFAKLGEITDPAAFVAAAKRMPPPPDLAAPAAATDGAARSTGDAATANGSADGNGTTAAGEDRLAERLAQLDERLGTATAVTPAPTVTSETASEAAEPPSTVPGAAGAGAATSATATAPANAPASTTSAPAAAETDAPAGAAPETSTPIVVKGLGSFGAITSFKQALERVDGIRGVTLSLGPTGDFVYRASHAGEFDLASAIRSIEGPNAEIEQVDGQLRVTIERPR